MKTVELTVQEYINFKAIANFWFDAYVKHGLVFVNANIEELLRLGY